MSQHKLGDGRSSFRAAIGRLVEIDPRSLAIFRIAVATIILIDLILRAPHIGAFYADDGMFSMEASRIYHGIPWVWSLNFLDGSAAFQQLLFVVLAVFAAMLLLGYRTRIAVIGCWLLVCSLHTRNHMVCNYGDMVLRVMLFWSMFLPLGRVWSLDARRRGDATRYPPVRGVASACILLQLCILYFFAGVWKYNEAWLSGDAVRTSLLLDYCGRPLGLKLLEFSALLTLLTHLTLWLEIAVPIMVWLPWKTDRIRGAAIIAFFALHIGIELCLTPGILSYVCMACWLLFLPSTFWDSQIVGRLSGGRWKTAGESPLADSFHSTGPAALPVTWTRRIRDGFCAAMMVYVVLWNAASLDWDRYGHFVPRNVRWVAHVSMLRQTWDMFYEPSKDNNWYMALGKMRNGSAVDVLREGRPVETESARQWWCELPSVRWRFFFRRLSYEEHVGFRPAAIEYLLRDWNERHSGQQQLVSVDLLHFKQMGKPEDFVSSSFGKALVEGDHSLDDFVQTLKTMEAGATLP